MIYFVLTAEQQAIIDQNPDPSQRGVYLFQMQNVGVSAFLAFTLMTQFGKPVPKSPVKPLIGRSRRRRPTVDDDNFNRLIRARLEYRS